MDSTNDTTGISNVVEETINVVTLPIDTLPIEQQSSAPIVPPSPIDINVVDQQVPVVNKKRRYIETITIDDEVEDIVKDVVSPMAAILDRENGEIVDSPTMNNNTFHNIIAAQPSDVTADQQNLTSMVEPKQKRIEDEVPVVANQSIKENVPKTGRDVAEETTVTNEDVPSTSEGIKKRPNSSMVDHNDNETAAKKGKNDEQGMVPGRRKNVDKCQICEDFNPYYQSKDEHVMYHAKIRKYVCLVDGCGFKTSYKQHILSHKKKEHTTQLECFRELKLTYGQKQTMREVRKTCFLTMKEKNQCQICNFSISGKHPIKPLLQKRLHAIDHLGIKLYKCTEEGCRYKGAMKDALNSHKQKMHGGGGKNNFQKDELTAEQELQVEEMLVKCFPNPNSNHIDDSNA